jgi:hypothetical protein
MYDTGRSARRRGENLASVVSVRFHPHEVELLRRAAPGNNVSRFVRQAALDELARIGGAADSGSGAAAPATSAVTDPVGTAAPSTSAPSTSAPSTGAFSIGGSPRSGGTGPVVPGDVGPGGLGQADTTWATANPS